MIITNEQDSKSVSTFAGKRIKYSVDPEAMGPIMSILSRQYSDTSLAPIREYTTNAIDATIEAGGVYRPVEITAPTMLNPIFSVQDFGIGMNAETIEQTYAFYGASTKRLSNNFNGSMGIGSKSAFAYTNQFTVVGIKDGIKTNVIISRDAEGGGDLEIVSETETDAPNGTTVSFTVNNVTYFKEKIHTFAGALAPGLVLVDGVDLSKWGTYNKIIGQVRDKSGAVVINGIYHIDRGPYAYGSSDDKIYMGGIAYPALESLSSIRTGNRHSIMADVPLGAVKFTPSRESLEDTPSTRAVHKQIEKVYVENIVKVVLADIKGADNIIDAYTTYIQNSNILTGVSVSYKGVDLKTLSIRVDQAHYSWLRRVGATYRATASLSYGYGTRDITASNMLFVTGFDVDSAKGVPASYKNKVTHYMDNEFVAPDWWRDNVDTEVMFVTEIPKEVTNNAVLKMIPSVDFEHIKAIKLPRQPRTGAAAKRPSLGGKFHVFDGTNGAWPTEQHIADFNTKDVYYVIGAQYKRGLVDAGRSTEHNDADTTFRAHMRKHRDFLGDNAVIVNLYASRKDKFLRDLGKSATEIVDHNEVTKAWMEDELAKLTPARAREAAAFGHMDSQVFKTLEWAKGNMPTGWTYDDPAIETLLAIEGEYYDTWTPFKWDYKMRLKAEKIIEDAGEEMDKEVESVKACYPLLDVVNYRYATTEQARALADYINYAYNNKTNGGK